ncbi:MAG TPA: fluoride efflux transporter CrcB [bacterium]|nr:fluoride efflux transporter CrcB [bacterium]HMW32816.1 fluoride efflux transporter CrcB [bacterium]HMW36565.1 fluoride efflux transporter CrcB [bacterium]HMY35414.1 fluoride efflux transporter CrcB [bacterium]HMZ04234.1 fluoride efflux transporter CrcB [bacterium]
MIQFILIGLGGALGAMARYGLQYVIQQRSGLLFPLGTLIVNLIGCFFIGFIMEIAEIRSAFNPQIRLFITVGLLGGFTTFSAFGYESILMMRTMEFYFSIFYIVGSIVGGLALVILGQTLARLL